MNKEIFEKIMENVKKLVTSEVRRNYLVSQPNYDTTIFFSETLLVI